MKGKPAKKKNNTVSSVVIQVCGALGNSLCFSCHGFRYLQKVAKMLIRFMPLGKKLAITMVIWRDRKSNSGHFKSRSFCVCNQSQHIFR